MQHRTRQSTRSDPEYGLESHLTDHTQPTTLRWWRDEERRLRALHGGSEGKRVWGQAGGMRMACLQTALVPSLDRDV